MPLPPDTGRSAEPTVGLVVVSHSPALAQGVVDVARAMSHPSLRMEPVGGAGGRLGTDATEVMTAMSRAKGPGGVLVLADLGGAVIASETAVDLLGWSPQEAIVSAGPLVEGAVAAAVAASAGQDLSRVAAEAEGALRSKSGLRCKSGVGFDDDPGPGPEPGSSIRGRSVADRPGDEAETATEGVSITFEMELAHGLHARPAATLVRAMSGLDAAIQVRNATTGSGPARASSLSHLVALGIRQGDRVTVTAHGPDTARVLQGVGRVIADRFGEPAAGPADQGPGVRHPGSAGSTVRASSTGSASWTGSAGMVGAAKTAGRPGLTRGLPASPGTALGPVVKLGRASSDPGREGGRGRVGWTQLEAAIRSAGEELATRQRTMEREGLLDAADLVEVQRLLLDDEVLTEAARRTVEEGGDAAEAWEQAVAEAAGGWEATGDEHLAARASDLAALSGLVLAHLDGTSPRRTVPPGSAGVLVCGPLDPATFARLDRANLTALAVVGGGAADHTAVMARSLGVPAVVGLPGTVEEIPEGTLVGVNGDEGTLEVEPPADRLASYQVPPSRRRLAAIPTCSGERPDQRTTTRDGREVAILANVSSEAEATWAAEVGAEGIGLVRTELLFAGWDHLPGEDEQLELLRKLGEAIGGRPMTVRTFDAGADKQLPWLPMGPEPNPALGQRGLRLGLARPDVLATQLRALARLGGERPVRVLLPMVTTAEELATAYRIWEEAGGQGRAELGIMVEVPAAALAIETLVGRAAFFSVGTNDLCQYVMAADRQNPAVARLADGMAPSVLTLVARVARDARAAGLPVAVCGELAADPDAVPVLVGLGIDELSVAPAAVAAVREAVRRTDTSTAERLAAAATELPTAQKVREMLHTWTQ